MQGRQLCVVSVREDNCQCCYMEGRQLSCAVTVRGDNCHVLLKGGDIVTWRGGDYDVLLKGGETFY